MKPKAIGIDFGTTNCSVALCDDPAHPKLLRIFGKFVVPTIINYSNGARFGKSFGKQDISSIKRKVGSEEIIHGKHVADICCDIFELIKSQIDMKLDGQKYQAIITVPAYFNDIQRNIIKMAAVTAGFDVLMILNEPTSAILSNNRIKEGVYMVYDFGGGTFDVSVISYSQGIYQVLGTSGNAKLGGNDIDEAIAKALNVSIKEAKKIKENNEIASQEIDDIYDEFANKTIKICSSLLESLNSKIQRLDYILMVGGSSKIQRIQDAIEAKFGIKPILKDPDTAVARGAAVKAYHLIHKTNHILIDVNPLTLGVELYGGGVDPIIRRNSRIPCKKSEVYTNISDDQEYLLINILQGESRFAKDCTLIGNIKLKISRRDPAIKPRFSIEFKIDVEGILKVKANQLGEEMAKEVIINPNYGLTKGKVIEQIKRHYNNTANPKDYVDSNMPEKAQELIDVVEEAINTDSDLLTKAEFDQISSKINEIKENLENASLLSDLCMELESLTNGFAERRIKRILNLK